MKKTISIILRIYSEKANGYSAMKIDWTNKKDLKLKEFKQSLDNLTLDKFQILKMVYYQGYFKDEIDVDLRIHRREIFQEISNDNTKEDS